MTHDSMKRSLASLGVFSIGPVSPYTILVRYADGNIRPATDLEAKLWNVLKEHQLV